MNQVEISVVHVVHERHEEQHAARAAKALKRETNSAVLGASVIHLLVLIQAWQTPGLVLRLLSIMVLATALNVWLRLRGPRCMNIERIEGVRVVLNGAYTIGLGAATHWEPAVWLFLPFMAVVAQGMNRHRSAHLAFHTLVVSAAAVALGADISRALNFSAFALVCYAITTAKTRALQEVLEEGDQQRHELEEARAELALANGQIQRDMVVLRKTEMELRQAQKLEAVGRLAAGIAHEINTPMQFVGDSVHFIRDGIAELLRVLGRYRALTHEAQPLAKASVTKTLQQIDEAADLAYLTENLPLAGHRAQEGIERVGVIVRSMKEFAHPDQATKTLIDLNRALQATLTIARHEYKYVAQCQTDLACLPAVPCFPGELNQVFLNLLVNAAHAIGDVHAKTAKLGTISIRTFQDGPDVVIQIADTGTGIPESAREHIFEPFFTTKEVGKGTGQGLALAHTTIERHGGRISFETELGRGTTFTIRLPIAGGDVTLISDTPAIVERSVD